MELMLKNVRLAFCQSALGDAEDYEGNKNFRHSATFIVKPGDANDKLIQEAIKAEAATLWGKKADGMLDDMRGSKTQWCYPKNKKDKAGEVYDGFEGMFALGAHRKQKDGKPILLDSIKDPATGKAAKLTGGEGRLYAGCYVNAKVSIYCQSGTNSGVRCSLLGIQYAGQGDSFGGAGVAKDGDFDAIDAPEEADDLA
jgi:hypothetical protein